jgi:DNA-binding transcriptional LysR family regulator
VELTPIGSLILGHAEAVLDRLREADDGLRSLRAGEVGRLVVGSFQSVSVNVLPDVIGQLRVERPGLSVRCIETDLNEELIAKLLSDELDLSFLIGMPDHDGLDAVELMVDPFVLLAPRGEEGPLVEMAHLNGMPMIGQSPCFCQLMIDDCLRGEGVEPDYVFRTNDNAAVQAMVRAGMGRAILPFLAVDMHDPDVVIAALQPPIPPRVITIARRKGRTLVPAAERFIELATDVCAALPHFERGLAGLVP